jgi:hypothetical protein
MKRRDLLRHLEQHGCKALREGASHSIWSNPGLAAKRPFPAILRSKNTLHIPSAVISLYLFPPAARLPLIQNSV